jgi:hypothetical protein
MDDEYENQDSLNPDETDTGLDTDGANDFSYEEPVVTDDDPEKAKLAEQNRRLYARIKKLEAKKEQPKVEPKPEKEPEPKAPVIDPEAIKNSLRDELRLEAQGFNEDEQKIIKRAATALGVSLLDAAKDDIVKGKIEAMREEQKVQNAIPSPSGKAGSTDTNSVEYYLRTGEIPEDDELADKVDEERIRRAREQI